MKPRVEPKTVCVLTTPPETMHSRWGYLVTKQEFLAAQQSDGFCRVWLVIQLTQEVTSRPTACYLLGEGLLFRYFPQVDGAASGHIACRPPVPCPPCIEWDE
ncbi:hypothetical protein MRX96_021346 [Rhipicephalus microplus]